MLHPEKDTLQQFFTGVFCTIPQPRPRPLFLNQIHHCTSSPIRVTPLLEKQKTGEYRLVAELLWETRKKKLPPALAVEYIVRRLSEAHKENIYKLFEGESLASFGFGFSVEEGPVKTRKNRPVWAQKDTQTLMGYVLGNNTIEILTMHKDGISAKEIASKLNMQQGTVEQRIRRGLGPKLQLRGMIALLYLQENLSDTEIAEKLGIKKQAAKDVIYNLRKKEQQ